jgi:hypothetical protein
VGGNPPCIDPCISAIAQRMPESHPMFTCMGGPGLTVTGVEGQRGNTLPVIRTTKV